jgi:hypothetical protein
MAIQITLTTGKIQGYSDPSTMVCVEVGVGVYETKRADGVEVGDMLCHYGPGNPPHSPGVEVTTVDTV